MSPFESCSVSIWRKVNSGNLLIENRNGLIVDAMAWEANGRTERGLVSDEHFSVDGTLPINQRNTML